MNLDRVAAVIRPRTYPESIDLGFRMVRAWWRPILGTWALAAVPSFAILLALLYRHPGWAMVVIWWLKPLYDRVPVYVLGRALFGDVPSTRETLRAWPGLLRRDSFAALTWRRFDPFRSLRLPVIQLEGQQGAARRQRWRLLAQDVRGNAGELLLTCATFEMVVFFGLFLGALTLLPSPEIAAWFTTDAPLDPSLLQLWTLPAFYMIAVAWIEPFYVAAGFGLYINRRTHLEAWDIEVVFRRIAARLRGDRRPATAVVRGAASRIAPLLLVLSAAAAPVLAAEPAGQEQAEPEQAEQALARQDPARVIQDVLADPVFGSSTTETYWTVPQDDARSPDSTTYSPLLGEWITWATYAVAMILVAIVLAWAVIYLIRRRGSGASPAKAPPDEPLPPSELVGMDVRQESLPDDVAGAARRLWESGERREALRLLYRGALSRLVSRDRAPLEPSATEGDCLRIVAPLMAAERMSYFRDLTESFQRTVYGHRPPDDERALHLISGWDAHFGGAA